MIYHIYLDGEKQGELTLMEYNRLKREVRASLRTWGAVAIAFSKGSINTASRIVKMIGALGGVVVLTAMFFAPRIYEAALPALADGATVAGMLQSVQLITAYICVVGVSIVMAADLLTPSSTLQAVFEGEFHRRIRAMKQIQRYGQIEVLGYPLPNRTGEQ
jgi:hypothetical protein